jgi:hypothetical protein
MSVRITSQENVAALFDSVTGWTVGPAFDNEEDAESFLDFTRDGPDLRTLTHAQLEGLLAEWREAQS